MLLVSDSRVIKKSLDLYDFPDLNLKEISIFLFVFVIEI